MFAIAQQYLERANTAAAAQLYRTMSMSNAAPQEVKLRYSQLASFCDVLTDPLRFPEKRAQTLIVEAVLDESLPEVSILFGHQSAQQSDLDAFESLIDSASASPRSEEGDSVVIHQKEQHAIGKAVKRLLLLIHPDKNSHPRAADAVRRVQLLRDEFSFAKVVSKSQSKEQVSGSAGGGSRGSSGVGPAGPDAFATKRPVLPVPQTQNDALPAPKRNVEKGKGQLITGGRSAKRPNDNMKAKGRQLDSLLSTLRNSKANTCKLQCDLSVEGVQSPTSPLSEKTDSSVFPVPAPATPPHPGVAPWLMDSHLEHSQSQTTDDDATLPLSPSLVSSFSVRPRGIGSVTTANANAKATTPKGPNTTTQASKLSESQLDSLQQAIHDAVEVKLGSGISPEQRQQILTATDISLSSSASLSLGSTLSYSRQTSSVVFLAGEGSVSGGSCSLKGGSWSTAQKEGSFLPLLPTSHRSTQPPVPSASQAEPDPRRMPSWIPRNDFDDCRTDPRFLLAGRSEGEKESVKVRVQVNVCPLGVKPLPKGKR